MKVADEPVTYINLWAFSPVLSCTVYNYSTAVHLFIKYIHLLQNVFIYSKPYEALAKKYTETEWKKWGETDFDY